MLQSQHIKPEDVFHTKDGADVYIRGQKPNSNFAVMLAHHFDGKLMEDILEVNFLIKNGKTAKADSILATLNKKVEDQIVLIPGIPAGQLKAPSVFAYEWQKDPNIVVQQQTAGRLPLVDINPIVKKGYHMFYSNVLACNYKKLDKLKSTVPAIDITLIRSVVATGDAVKINTAIFNSLISLTQRKELAMVLSGEVGLKEDFLSSAVKESNLPGRIKNLKASVATLEKMIQTNESLIARRNSPDLVMLNTALKSLQVDCRANADMTEEIYKVIKLAIYGNSNFTYSSWAMGNNEVWDLKTAGSYQVIPDIGVASIYATGNTKNEVIIRPYIGASIYLRPVDKNVPYKYFDEKYRWLHRFSFNFGVTLGNNDQGEFSGFFNGMNLLLGANYKIIRPISISGGVSLMKRANSNPAIDAKQTVVNPYIALSFDVDFMSTIQKLTGNFIK